MQRTCSAASKLTAGRQRASTSAVAPALVAVNAAYLQLHWAIGPQVASAWYTAQPSQLRLRPRSSQQVDGGQQPAQLRVRPLLCSQQVDGGQQPAQLRLRRWACASVAVNAAARASVAVNAADLQPAGRECIAASVVACAAAHVSAGRRRLRLGVAVNAAGGKPVAVTAADLPLHAWR